MSMGEYDYEPIRGLPGNLPPGESLLWQGSPEWLPLARRAFRVVPVALYFVVLAIWRGSVVMASEHQWSAALHGASILLLLGLVTVGVLSALAWLAARATVYSITSQRVVIRHGIALPMSLNLPLAKINTVALSTHGDGTGEVALALVKGERVGYLLNWPHVRPLHFLQPQPTLRGIRNPQQVAAVLTRALTASGAASATPAANDASAPAADAPQSSALA